MGFRDDMTHAASRGEMFGDPAELAWLAEVDATIAPFTPDGYDASLDGAEWVLAKRAYHEKRNPKLFGMQLVHLRGWVDDANDSLALALRVSIALAGVEKRVAALAAQQDRTANVVQGLPNRDDYDALVAENEQLRQQVRALSLQRVA